MPSVTLVARCRNCGWLLATRKNGDVAYVDDSGFVQNGDECGVEV